MDDLDRAAELEEKQRAQAMKHRKAVPKKTGFCLNCGLELKSNSSFCDPEPDGDGCMRDWEKAGAARLRSGV